MGYYEEGYCETVLLKSTINQDLYHYGAFM